MPAADFQQVNATVEIEIQHGKLSWFLLILKDFSPVEAKYFDGTKLESGVNRQPVSGRIGIDEKLFGFTNFGR